MLDDSTREKIIEHYQKGQGSIQDIARVYRLTVNEVLQIIGINNISKVTTQGDLIGPEEAGPGATIVPSKDFDVPFTTN